MCPCVCLYCRVPSRKGPLNMDMHMHKTWGAGGVIIEQVYSVTTATDDDCMHAKLQQC